MSKNRSKMAEAILRERYPYRIDTKLIHRICACLDKPRPQGVPKPVYRFYKTQHARLIATLVALPYDIWKNNGQG